MEILIDSDRGKVSVAITSDKDYKLEIGLLYDDTEKYFMQISPEDILFAIEKLNERKNGKKIH